MIGDDNDIKTFRIALMVYNRAIINSFNNPEPELITELVEYNLRLLVTPHPSKNCFNPTSMYMEQGRLVGIMTRALIGLMTS